MCLKYLKFKPYLGILIILFLCIAIISSTCPNCTENNFKFTEILSRKRRYLIFPPGATILCTLSVVKALMFASPRNHNMVMEVDFYYPLPDKVILPKKHNPKPVGAPKETASVAPNIIEIPKHEHYDDFHNFLSYPNDVYISRRKSDKKIFLQKSDYTPKKLFFNKYANYMTPISRGNSWYKMRKKRSEILKSNIDLKHEEHKGHKDRRHLYKSIEKFIDDSDVGLDGHYCVLRTICEAQSWLLPKGTSLFHDIFRVLFSLPSESKHVDPYKKAMAHEDDKCKVYEKRCPISILSFVLHSERVL